MTLENIGRDISSKDFSKASTKDLKTVIRNAVRFEGSKVDEEKLQLLDLKKYSKQEGGVLQSLPEIIEKVQKFFLR